jgi:hypothetical protein
MQTIVKMFVSLLQDVATLHFKNHQHAGIMLKKTVRHMQRMGSFRRRKQAISPFILPTLNLG